GFRTKLLPPLISSHSLVRFSLKFSLNPRITLSTSVAIHLFTRDPTAIANSPAIPHPTSNTLASFVSTSFPPFTSPLIHPRSHSASGIDNLHTTAPVV